MISGGESEALQFLQVSHGQEQVKATKKKKK